MAKKSEGKITPADKPVFYWETTDFQNKKKTGNWFTSLFLVALVRFAAFLWMRLWLAAAVVIAAAFAMYSQSRSSGSKRSYAIYSQGVTIDNRVYTFDQFKSFWVFPYEQRIILRFEQVKRFSLPVEMPLDEKNVEQIRLFLSKHLPEEEGRGEDITDTINRWIKF
jgi:hypothetical protein